MTWALFLKATHDDLFVKYSIYHSILYCLSMFQIRLRSYEMQRQIEKMKTRLAKMEDENQQLKSQLRESLATERELRADKVKAAVTISDLEQTIQIVRDDYVTECQQKERLLTNNKELSLELSLVKRQVNIIEMY